ncbi:Hairy/enhancer-of-split related with YRPW motif-like protein [Camelus dromedarius]|uniref:Hairy/enhancer-of-split related with YRPW motif-like protein n=1 Tax=Camelus dromedarius TaxID=9838 RepID=A0A5N4DC71_CAMDR|nr:Hairy/enhancer-of-split related with YRPW motif-like protein [Camelus dromedarius]
MKRPREPIGSDSESEGPIDVGREGELRPGRWSSSSEKSAFLFLSRQMARPLSTPSPSQMQARKKRRGIIEKRRRDRINSSLSELRRLVPTAFEKQAEMRTEEDLLDLEALAKAEGQFQAVVEREEEKIEAVSAHRHVEM